jgi:peptide/nickel transport system substrate-binding protein
MRNRFKASLKSVAVAGAVAMLTLSACSSSDSGGGTPNAAPTDKVLHLSFLQDPGQPPDPDVYYAGQGLLLTTNTYEGLLQFKGGQGKAEFEPLLATEWTVSPDNKVFTLKLREGVKFHDGTPFKSDAVKASFDRRLAVNGGPAYMVKDIESITTQGDYGVTITLKSPNSEFLDYLASAYGPRMMSPTGLQKNGGSDFAQNYLTTHDLGTGPYTLTDAQVGSHYSMSVFPEYWGPKPYFEKVEMPVITDASAMQLQFNNGQLAAILHDLPSSAVEQYLNDPKYAHYSLPTMMSNYLYINPTKGMMKDQANRTAIMQAVDVDQLVKQTYFGRGKIGAQMYPPYVLAAEYGKQTVTHDPSALSKIAAALPADQKSVTIGYDTSNPDNQLISNLVQTQLAAAGLTAKVQGYPTSEIYGWIGNASAAPEIYTGLVWPDAPSPYTWGHISWDADGGINYLSCSSPRVTAALAAGLPNGVPQPYADAGTEAQATGCWLNVADIDDFVVAQPWLKGVEQAHAVSNPNSLRIAALSVG